MPSRSRFAKRLSTNAAALLVGATGASAVAGAIGLVGGVPALAAVGLIAAIAFAGCLAVRARPIGALALTRAEPFRRWDVIRATVLADFASRAVENAQLVAEAGERETERARLTERLITAEQDERRRLSLFLHDGPLQS